MDLILFRLSLAPFANNRVAVILMDKKIIIPIAENAIQLPMLLYGLMGIQWSKYVANAYDDNEME